jgi:DNA-binding response OmpR family regulator
MCCRKYDKGLSYNQQQKKLMQKKILVADDDPAIIDCLQIILEEANYLVETSSNGDTIPKVKRFMPDLILLDVWMSGEDGRNICKYLKSLEKTKHIPIIMISATSYIEESTRKAGAEDFIPKPFQMDELLTRVERYV